MMRFSHSLPMKYYNVYGIDCNYETRNYKLIKRT